MSQTNANAIAVSYRLQPPEELVFKGPFSDYVSQRLKIENTGETPIGFKVKTTTPKKFSVKPNMGCIEAHGSQDIIISLHSFTYDPNDKTRHKFMVQVVSLTAITESGTVESMIKDYERNNPTKLRESKLRVAIVPADADLQQNANRNGNVYPPPQQPVGTATGASSGAPGSGTGAGAPLNTGSLPNIDDFRQLEMDVSALRNENSQLKEQNAYQRRQIAQLERGGKSNGDVSGGLQTDSSGSAMQRMGFLILVLFIGMIMGFYISHRTSK